MLFLNNLHHVGQFAYLAVNCMISGMLIFIIRFFAPTLFIKQFQNYQSVINDMTDSLTIMNQISYIYLGIVLFLLLLTFFHKKSIKNQ